MAGPPYQPLIDAAKESAQKAALEKQQTAAQNAAEPEKLAQALNPYHAMNVDGQKAAAELGAERTARDQHQARVEADFNVVSKQSLAPPERQIGAQPSLTRLNALYEARTPEGEPTRPPSQVDALQNARDAMAKGEDANRDMQSPGAPAPGGMTFTAKRTYDFRRSHTKPSEGGRPAEQSQQISGQAGAAPVRIEALYNALPPKIDPLPSSRFREALDAMQPPGSPWPTAAPLMSKRTYDLISKGVYDFSRPRTKTPDGSQVARADAIIAACQPTIHDEASRAAEAKRVTEHWREHGEHPDRARWSVEEKQLRRKDMMQRGKDVAFTKAYFNKHGHYPPDQYDDPEKGIVTIKVEPEHAYSNRDYPPKESQSEGTREQKDSRTEKSDRFIVKTAKLQITERTDKSLGRGVWVPGQGGRSKGGRGIGE